MAGMTRLVKQGWLKAFPPSQQRAITGATQGYLSGYKTASTSIVSSVTLAADSELVIPQVQAGVPYAVSGVLNITASAAAGGAQFNFNAGTATIQSLVVTSQFYTAAGAVTQGAVATALNTAVTGGTVAINVMASFSGIVTFATSGSFGMNVAQAGSSATATVIDVNSCLLLEAIAPVGLG